MPVISAPLAKAGLSTEPVLSMLTLPPAKPKKARSPRSLSRSFLVFDKEAQAKIREHWVTESSLNIKQIAEDVGHKRQTVQAYIQKLISRGELKPREWSNGTKAWVRESDEPLTIEPTVEKKPRLSNDQEAQARIKELWEERSDLNIHQIAEIVGYKPVTVDAYIHRMMKLGEFKQKIWDENKKIYR